MLTSELFYFTARCLTLDENPDYKETVVEVLLGNTERIYGFIDLCDKQLILPAIYLQFEKHDLLSLFPDELWAHLATLYLRNKKRNFDILSQVDEINQAFHKKNITPVYLKGTAHLLDNLYHDSGQRVIGDIDLLVQEHDYFKAAELIKNRGYKCDKIFTGDLSRHKHYPRLFREDVPCDIEIHRIPVENKYGKQLNSINIFQHKKEIAGKTNCFVPCEKHQAMHNFIHCQLANMCYRFKTPTLRDLYDMYLLSQKTDPEKIIDQASKSKKIKHYLLLTEKVFGNKKLLRLSTDKQFLCYLEQWQGLMNHPKKHHRYILRVKITDLIFYRFFPAIIKLFTQIPSVKHITQTLFNPVWYKLLAFRFRNFYLNYISKESR